MMGIFFHVYTLLYNIGEWRSGFLAVQERVYPMPMDIQ